MLSVSALPFLATSMLSVIAAIASLAVDQDSVVQDLVIGTPFTITIVIASLTIIPLGIWWF